MLNVAPILSKESLEQVRMAVERYLAAGAPPDSTPSEAAARRFIGRLEYFGCLLFDRERGDYIPFDQEATDIFRLAQSEPLERVYGRIKISADRKSLETFTQLCQSINILDAWGRFTGTFLHSAATVPNVVSAPLRVHLALTNACNFACAHCFSSSGQPYRNEMTTGEIKRLIDELADLGCFQLSMGGGEPLVRRDLPELVRHANSRAVAVEISTNAAAASREVVDTLRGASISIFRVSMDAASAPAYDALRGEDGAFQQAMEGIANLRTLGALITLRHVMMAPNVSELNEMIRLAESLGAVEISFAELLPAGRAAAHPGLLLDWEAINRLWNDAAEAQGRTRVRISIPHRVPVSGKHLFTGFGCRCGQLSCYVDARGEVAPSGLLKDGMRAGSLRLQSFKEIWDTSPAFAQLRRLPGNGACRQCPHFAACRGGCRASAMLSGADLNAPDANCAVARTPPGAA